MINENAVILLEEQGLIRVAGHDAENFLQGLITIDIREIDGIHTHLGGCCNNKGRVIASFDLLKYKQAYYLLLPRANILNTIAHLRKYALFSKVETQDVTDQFKILGLWGEGPLMPLKTKAPMKVGECVQTEWGVLSKLHGDASRFRLIVESEQVQICFPQLEAASSFLNAWKRCDILSGVSAIYPETAGLFTPQMLNYDDFGAISLTKGCYLGQEIVARTASLGRVKKHLHKFHLESNQLPERGTPLYDARGSEVGIVLDACQEKGRVDLSAVVQDDALKDKLYWQNEALIRL